MDHEHVILLMNVIAFLQMYKYLLNALHPPNVYVLDLSPASTKCTHDVAIKFFAGMWKFDRATALTIASSSTQSGHPDRATS